MNSKDKAFLEKFCVNESSNLTGLENFWAAGFSITARFGGTPTISHHTPPKLPPPPPPPPPNLHNLPRKALLSPYYHLKWEIKNFNNKISQCITFIASLPHAKTNFMNKLFLKIKLSHYLLLLCAYSGMTEHTHLKHPSNI